MLISEARNSDRYRLIDGDWWYYPRGGKRRRASTGICKHCGQPWVGSNTNSRTESEFCSPQCSARHRGDETMTNLRPRKPKHDPTDVWQFAALDPVGAHLPGQLTHTIVNRYSNQGAALERLRQFARKQYRAEVRERVMRASTKDRSLYTIYDCRFRWRNGAPGYATIRQVVDDGDALDDLDAA